MPPYNIFKITIYQYTAPESVQNTNKRVERIQEYVRQLKEETESDCKYAEQL